MVTKQLIIVMLLEGMTLTIFAIQIICSFNIYISLGLVNALL